MDAIAMAMKTQKLYKYSLYAAVRKVGSLTYWLLRSNPQGLKGILLSYSWELSPLKKQSLW